jgi:translation initiation factor RLI1
MLQELSNGNNNEIFRQKEKPIFVYRFILHCKKTGFVVEHDFIMATYLADRVIVFDGKPSVDAHASEYDCLAFVTV